MYDYQRMLPHYQKAGRALFVTFCKLIPMPFTPPKRVTQFFSTDAKTVVSDINSMQSSHARAVRLLLTPLGMKRDGPTACLQF